MHKPTRDTMPTLPEPAIVDRGIVRFASVAASELKPLSLPASDVADRGIVRLGSTGITFER